MLPLTPLIECKRLREKSLPAPRREDPDALGATIVVTATQHQCTAGTVRTLPPAAGVKATLVAAHRLLNNPPSMHASPSAVEQWRHDVDQLVVAAINTPRHEGGRQEPVAAHSHSPSVACALPSLACLIRHVYCRALRRPTSMMSSSATTEARIVASPLSTTVKGAATLRAATSSEILNLLCRHERRPRHMLCDPLALQRAPGVYGACTTSSDGGLAVQILTPPVGEVRWDGQSR
jgi:hypothetical protein